MKLQYSLLLAAFASTIVAQENPPISSGPVTSEPGPDPTGTPGCESGSFRCGSGANCRSCVIFTGDGLGRCRLSAECRAEDGSCVSTDSGTFCV